MSRMIFILLCVIALSATTMERYSRKSISIFKMSLSSQVKKKIKRSEVDCVYDEMFETIVDRLGRFDYNPIPVSINNPKELFKIVKDYTATKIEERAAKQWDIKNKYYGSNFITGENVDKIMDGAYIIFPRIEEFIVPSTDNGDGVYSLSVSLKIYSARNIGTIENPNWQPKLEKKISASGLGSLATVINNVNSVVDFFDDDDDDDDDEKKKKDNSANIRKNGIQYATALMLEFLTKELKKLDFFKIKALVSKSNPKKDKVTFDFGHDVGVKVGDAYTVGYMRKNKKGKFKYVETGFMKVRKVFDKESENQLLIVSNPYNDKESDLFCEGSQVYEYPLAGFNIVPYGGITSVKGFKSVDDVSKLNKYSRAYNFGVKVEFDLSGSSNIPELYVALDGGICLKEFQEPGDSSSVVVTALTGDLSLVQKFYIRRFGYYLGLGLGGTLNTLNLSDEFSDKLEKKLKDNNIDFLLFGGFNYLLFKNVFLDLNTGWRFYHLFSFDDYKDEDEDDRFIDEEFPKEDDKYFMPSGFYVKFGIGICL